MRINPIQLHQTNQLIKDYRAQAEAIIDFFDYKPFTYGAERVEELQTRKFPREKLSAILFEMNREWNAPNKTLQQIERLKKENSVVVIGGQQAGLITGPMYTVNKIISIIKLAKEQEAKLQIPVIPVFWIAGEDHDYDEINHIHTLKNNKIYKHTTKQQLLLKQSISHVELDQDKTLHWIKQAFHDLAETEFSKDLYEKIVRCLEQSKTYVDFFARIIFELFPEEGVVLIDSANPNIRKLESNFFKQFIYKQRDISKAVYETVQSLEQKGYAIPLDVEMDDANLFFHDENNERILLKRLENIWVGKNDEVDLTTEQLLEIAQFYPERLSNNVITRPMMQEFLFPTIAFVAGDGEISYWAALKKAFHILDLKMPPVVPRLSITFMTARTEKLLNARVLQAESIVNQGIETIKLNWLMAQQKPPIKQLYKEAKQSIEQIHQPLRNVADTLSADLAEVAEKNLQNLLHTISYLEQKTIAKLNEKYERQLNQFDEINFLLKPNQLLQERVWSPLFFVNEYGLQFIQDVIDAPDLSLQNNHYIVYLA